MDPCVGPKGEDLCHLAKGPPKVDFRNIEKQKKQTVRTVEEASKFIRGGINTDSTHIAPIQ